jgi:hypothetical protein
LIRPKIYRWDGVHLFENWREKNVDVSAPSLIGKFRGIDNGQMDGETEGQVSRNCNRATYKPTYIPQLPSANKAQGKHMHFAQTK